MFERRAHSIAAVHECQPLAPFHRSVFFFPPSFRPISATQHTMPQYRIMYNYIRGVGGMGRAFAVFLAPGTRLKRSENEVTGRICARAGCNAI